MISKYWVGGGWILGFCLAFPLEAGAVGIAEAGRINYSEFSRGISQTVPRVAPKARQIYDFKLDPKTEEIIEMTLRSEHPVLPGEIKSPFSEESIRSGDYVLQKGKYDKKLGFESRQGRAAWMDGDRAESLVGPLKYSKLAQIEAGRLQSARLNRIPWSSSYWPTYAGGVATRYADPNFTASSDWKKNVEYLKGAVPKSLSDLTPEQINLMSPAEKYDVLVGDSNFTLTQQEFSSAEQAVGANGKIETWEGKCHGWSPAAFLEKRPHHSITVRAYDPSKPGNQGVSVKFYPDDMKALATLLWANAPTQSRFVGSRCNVKKPKTDENGRILEESCFDTNPGTWHLLTVNQLGVKKEGFVLDATYDYEVWNQPAFAYEYSYFNPKEAVKHWDSKDDEKFNQLSTWRQAAVDLKDFPEDKFKAYRGSKAVTVVGISMKFTYVSEHEVSHEERDSAESSILTSVRYFYDLELDAQGNIVGGEWYQLAHPDFMWAPVGMAASVGDEVLDRDRSMARWKKREVTPISDQWREAALQSSNSGQPLARIIAELIQKSRKYPGYTVLHFFFWWLESHME